MPKIIDVAKEANVSVATVSRVLNRNKNVREKTRKRVLKAVEKLQYIPNAHGRNLRRTNSRLILVLLPEISNPFYSDIVKGIENKAHENSFNILLCNTEDDLKREKVYVEMLKNKMADGAIFLASEQQKNELEVIASNYPIVQCCEYHKDSKITHVSINNYIASKEAVEYLLKIGRKNILMISNKNDYLSTSQREKAFKDIVNNSKEVNGRIIKGDYSFLSGYKCIKEYLKQENKVDGIFCISDLTAIGAMKAIREMEYKIPNDISIIGFDNIRVSSMFETTLSTIAQPRYMIGRKSAEILINKIEGVDKSNLNGVFLKHQLIIRKSS